MKKINITLPDNSIKSVDAGTTAIDLASQIGTGLARAVLVVGVDDTLKDLDTKLDADCRIKFFTGDSHEGHNTLLHSAAHLMAQSVKHFWPKAKLTIGPAIDNRFYYDFDIDHSFTNDDLIKIENKMHDLSKSDFKCIRCEITRKEAYKKFMMKRLRPDG